MSTTHQTSLLFLVVVLLLGPSSACGLFSFGGDLVVIQMSCFVVFASNGYLEFVLFIRRKFLTSRIDEQDGDDGDIYSRPTIRSLHFNHNVNNSVNLRR